MSEQPPLSEMIIEDVLLQWPQTADVFQRYNMACVGCVMAPFYTVADAIAIYGLSPEPFLADLEHLIDKQSSEQKNDVTS